MGLIHMNGRIYDALLGRFLQADPFVEDATTLNRYTYVHNNPLAYTDPSGYFSVKKALRLVGSIIVGAVAVTAGIAMGGFPGFLIAVAGGFASGFIATGTLKGAYLSAGIAALSFGIGQWASGTGAKTTGGAGASSAGPAVDLAESAVNAAAARTMKTPATIAQTGAAAASSGASAGNSLVLPTISVSAAAVPQASTLAKVMLENLAFESLETMINSYLHVLSLRYKSGSYIDEASRRRAQDELAAHLGIRSGDMPWGQMRTLHEMNAVVRFAQGAQSIGTLFASLPVGGVPGRAGVAASGASSRILGNSPSQLQRKFKHAGDFGVAGNYSRANAVEFSRALNQHVNSNTVRAVSGTYRGNPVTHYVDPGTGLNVITDRAGNFVSGWRLSDAQLQNVLRRGSL
jgi:hypothetical protein